MRQVSQEDQRNGEGCTQDPDGAYAAEEGEGEGMKPSFRFEVWPYRAVENLDEPSKFSVAFNGIGIGKLRVELNLDQMKSLREATDFKKDVVWIMTLTKDIKEKKARGK